MHPLQLQLQIVFLFPPINYAAGLFLGLAASAVSVHWARQSARNKRDALREKDKKPVSLPVADQFVDITKEKVGSDIQKMARDAGMDELVVNRLSIYQRRFQIHHPDDQIAKAERKANPIELFGVRDFCCNSNYCFIRLPSDFNLDVDRGSVWHELGHIARASRTNRKFFKEISRTVSGIYIILALLSRSQEASRVFIPATFVSAFSPWFYALYDEYSADCFAHKHSSILDLQEVKRDYENDKSINRKVLTGTKQLVYLGNNSNSKMTSFKPDSIEKYGFIGNHPSLGFRASPYCSSWRLFWYDTMTNFCTTDPHPPSWFRILMINQAIKKQQ